MSETQPKEASLTTLFASVLPVLDEVAGQSCMSPDWVETTPGCFGWENCGKCLSCRAAVAAVEVRAVMERLTEGTTTDNTEGHG